MEEARKRIEMSVQQKSKAKELGSGGVYGTGPTRTSRVVANRVSVGPGAGPVKKFSHGQGGRSASLKDKTPPLGKKAKAGGSVKVKQATGVNADLLDTGEKSENVEGWEHEEDLVLPKII